MSPPYPKAMEAFPVLRQSTLAKFDACALTTKMSIAHDHGWTSAPAARGSILHRVYAKCLAIMAEHNEDKIEVDVALAVLHECLRQADVPDSELLVIPMNEIADMYWEVKKWAYENVWSIGMLLSIEERFQTLLRYPDPDGGFVERPFSGMPDAIFATDEGLTGAIILDWKSSWALPAPSEISESGFFQQRSYALLIMDKYTMLQSITLREFYSRYSQAREATIYRDDLDNIRLEMEALAERFDRCFETNTWPPQPGKHCSYCTRPTACPIFPKTRRVGMIETTAQASRVADQVIVAEASLKGDKEALKAWAAVHGPVPIRDQKQSGRVYGHREAKRIERPAREELEQAMADGNGRINLDALYKEKTSTRFEAHVPKPRDQQAADDELLALLEQSLADRRQS